MVRATRTALGPASLRLRWAGDEVAAEAWGPGASSVLAALPALLGELDDPSRLTPQHVFVGELARRFAGLRMTRGTAVYELLLPTIIAQKVSSHEALPSYWALVRRFGDAAPGPLGLMLPPSPEALARLPYHSLHPLGIERRRADALREAARVAGQLERAAASSAQDLRRALTSLPGIGSWTAAEVVRLALGDPDEVSVGDYNLPSLVSWTLAGERRADDSRMLELLEPYRGQRARVVLLLELSGRYPPRHGPRLAARRIRAL